MKTAVRAVLSAVAFVAAFYFVFWMSGAALLSLKAPLWISHLLGIACAAGAGWFVWTKSAATSGSGAGRVISSVVLGAIVVGAIGFSIGFFGPLIFTPSSNQGPLLGIFITGPAGFVLGAIGGLIYGLIKLPRVDKEPQTPGPKVERSEN
jgi:hypothetical protein